MTAVAHGEKNSSRANVFRPYLSTGPLADVAVLFQRAMLRLLLRSNAAAMRASFNGTVVPNCGLRKCNDIRSMIASI
jgi:hypothetical protein